MKIIFTLLLSVFIFSATRAQGTCSPEVFATVSEAQEFSPTDYDRAVERILASPATLRQREKTFRNRFERIMRVIDAERLEYRPFREFEPEALVYGIQEMKYLFSVLSDVASAVDSIGPLSLTASIEERKEFAQVMQNICGVLLDVIESAKGLNSQLARLPSMEPFTESPGSFLARPENKKNRPLWLGWDLRWSTMEILNFKKDQIAKIAVFPRVMADLPADKLWKFNRMIHDFVTAIVAYPLTENDESSNGDY